MHMSLLARLSETCMALFYFLIVTPILIGFLVHILLIEIVFL